jgi:putative ABC transport system permease protein
MLKNYFLITWRTLWKYKAFSGINIFGLALGMTCSLLIFLWVRDELSYDQFHTNVSRLFIIYEQEFADGKRSANYGTPGLLATELKRHVPEIRFATPIHAYGKRNFEAGGKMIKESGYYADGDFFRMFSYPLLQGAVDQALSDPAAIAISDKMARRFFGSAGAAMGKTLRFENTRNYTVKAVFADPPANSIWQFDYVINWMAHLEDADWLKDWTNNSPQTVVMLNPNADAKALGAKLRHFLANYNHTFSSSFRLEIGLQPFGELYLHSNFVDGELSGGRIEYVRLFSIIAVFILVIACINYMNLTTARSQKRAREIGIRKVAGAIRGSLIRQFLSEAVLVTLIAEFLAVVLVNLLLPVFNGVTGKQIVFPFANTTFWLGLLAITLVTGLLAGSYPAFFLSAFRPIQVLKGTLKTSIGAIFFRKGLVVFQFVLSIVLIIGTIVIAKQIDYVQHANLGFDKDNLVFVPLEGDLGGQYAVFKEQARRIPGIRSVTTLSDYPTYIGGTITGSVNWPAKAANTTPQFWVTSAGYDLVRTLHLQLRAGRDFSRDYPSDSSAYLINEKTLAVLGYKDPIGKPLELWGVKGTIVGLLRDFHLTSLHDPIQPLIVRLSDARDGGYILLSTESGKTRSVLAGLKDIWTGLNPKFPFSYFFADDEFRKLYVSETVVSSLANCFAALAIIISCMGLLGLAMFRVELRLKEIGIRKVLGASVLSLLALLSGEFLALVLLALLIACPLAWWVMDNWLKDFAYQTPIDWWIFGLAGGLAVFIALLTVGWQAVKAAIANPVRALRSE